MQPDESWLSDSNDPLCNRFTDRARKVRQLANQEAQRLNHEYIGSEHILLGLVKEGSGIAAKVLISLGATVPAVRRELERIVPKGRDAATPGKLPLTPRAKLAIQHSMDEARNLNHGHVGTEHMLLALMRDEEGVAAQVLAGLGLRLEDVRAEVMAIFGVPTAAQRETPGKSCGARKERGRDAASLFGQSEESAAATCDVPRVQRHGDISPHLCPARQKPPAGASLRAARKERVSRS